MRGNEIMEKRKTSPKRVIAFVILGIGACTMVLPFLYISRIYHTNWHIIRLLR